MEFKIKQMVLHEDGYAIATILSYRDQNEYEIHNKCGSWLMDDPEREGWRREVARTVAAGLQDYYKRHRDKLKTVKSRVNPFTARKAKKNPFDKVAAKKKPNVFQKPKQNVFNKPKKKNLFL